jgi:hypothetical protein
MSTTTACATSNAVAIVMPTSTGKRATGASTAPIAVRRVDNATMATSTHPAATYPAIT